MSRAPKFTPGVLNVVDLVYVVPAFAASEAFGATRNSLGVALLAAATLSWLQDWTSAKAASSYFQGRLTIFDAVTAANYFGLFLALGRAASVGPLASHAVLVHYAAVFVIYALWNIYLIRESDKPTRIFLGAFTAVAIGLALVAGYVVHTRTRLPMLIAISIHLLMLVAWRRIRPPQH